MRTLKEHILERLKVSASQAVTMTYREFFELLKEYTKVTGYVAFIPSRLCDDVDEMPKYYNDETKYITTIQPYTTTAHLEIGLFLRDINDHKVAGYRGVNIAQNGDDIVDFTDDLWLNKIIKYMQEAIKK